jgi:hypothetical protein
MPTKKYVNRIYPFINVILITVDIILNAIIMFDNNYLLLAITILNINIEFSFLSIILYNAITCKRNNCRYLIVNTLAILYHIINIILIVIFNHFGFIRSLSDPRVYVVIYTSLHICMIIFSINKFTIKKYYNQYAKTLSTPKIFFTSENLLL